MIKIDTIIYAENDITIKLKNTNFTNQNAAFLQSYLQNNQGVRAIELDLCTFNNFGLFLDALKACPQIESIKLNNCYINDFKIGNYENPKLKEIIINYPNFTKASLEQLFTSLSNFKANPKKLSLTNTHIPKDLLIQILVHVLTNQSPVVLDISGNNLGDDGIEQLAGAIGSCRTLEELNLSNNQISEKGGETLSKNLSPNLIKFNLQSNKLGDLGAISLASELIENKSVREINLQKNLLTDHSAVPLAIAYKKNKNLKVIELRENDIGNEGARAFAEAIVENRNIFSVGLRDNKKIDIEGAKAILAAVKQNPNILKIALVAIWDNTPTGHSNETQHNIEKKLSENGSKIRVILNKIVSEIQTSKPANLNFYEMKEVAEKKEFIEYEGEVALRNQDQVDYLKKYIDAVEERYWKTISILMRYPSGSVLLDSLPMEVKVIYMDYAHTSNPAPEVGAPKGSSIIKEQKGV